MIPLIDRPQQLLSARRAGDIDRLLHGVPAAGAGAQQQTQTVPC